MSSQKEAVKELSPTAKHLVKHKTLTKKMRVMQWIALFNELSAFDRVTDKLLKKNKIIAIVFAVLSFLSIFASAIVAAYIKKHSNFPPLSGFSISIACIAATVFFWRKFNYYASIDLMNDFWETLLPVFRLISEDLADKAKITVSLDLEPIHRKKDKTKKNLPTHFIKLTQTTYESNIAKVQIPLENDVILNLSINKKALELERDYRSARGKHKSKTKWKLLSSIKATLVYPLDIKIDKNNVKKNMTSGYKDGKQFYSLGIKRKSKNADCPQFCFEPKQVMKLLMQLCAVVSSKKGGK